MLTLLQVRQDPNHRDFRCHSWTVRSHHRTAHAEQCQGLPVSETPRYFASGHNYTNYIKPRSRLEGRQGGVFSMRALWSRSRGY